MSHVVLNFFYRLRMMSIGRFKTCGFFQRLLELVVKSPDYSGKLFEVLINAVLNGVRAAPVLSEEVEGKVLSTFIGLKAVLTPRETPEQRYAERGLVQIVVKHSSRAESMFTISALVISMSLQRLQRSLERSLLTSALLSGIATTLALLFLALRFR